MKKRLIYLLFLTTAIAAISNIWVLRYYFYYDNADITADISVVLAFSAISTFGGAGLISGADYSRTLRMTVLTQAVLLGPVFLAYWAGGVIYAFATFFDREMIADIGLRPVIATAIWWVAASVLIIRHPAFQAVELGHTFSVRLVALLIVPALTIAALMFLPLLIITQSL